MKLRKRIAGVISVILAIWLIIGDVQMQTNAEGTKTQFTINITNNSGYTNGNIVMYRFNDSEGWQQAESGKAVDLGTNNSIIVYVERAKSSDVLVDFSGSTGFDTTDFKGTLSNNGQRFDLTEGSTYVLDVNFVKNGSNSSQPDNPNPPTPDNPNPPTQEIKDPETISVGVSEGDSLLEPFGNNITVDGMVVSDGKVTVEKADAHKIGVLCQFGFSINRAVINGAEVKASSQDGGWYYYDVADASSYDVKLYAGSNTYTIAWMNSGALGDDAKIEHGSVEIIPAGGITDMTDGDHKNGGHYAVEPGTLVTIRLIPDYGYQLKSTDLNGATVAAGSTVSTFTFEMPETNLHLAALFEKTEDKIDCTASDVIANAAIGNGQNATSSGNLKMTVEDNSAYDKDVTGVVDGASVKKVASVDLTLDNIVSKGDDSYWTSNITEFTNPISVGLKLDSSALSDKETYSVVRDHNGTLTELNTKYDAETGTITFDTNQFSTYTIVKKVKADNSDDLKDDDLKKNDDLKNDDLSGGALDNGSKGEIKNGTKADTNACSASLGESADTLADKVLTDAEKKRVENGESVNVYLDVADISASVSNEDKALIEAKKGNSVIGMYLDINLFKKIGGDDPLKVTNTSGKVQISLKVPDKLINKDASKTRTYSIIRLHDKEASVIDCKFDSDTGILSFETDEFSTYALAYSDKGTEKVKASPQTADTGMAGVWFALAAISAGGIFCVSRKRKAL